MAEEGVEVILEAGADQLDRGQRAYELAAVQQTQGFFEVVGGDAGQGEDPHAGFLAQAVGGGVHDVGDA